jgi:predicted MPP superfamily phosphohydrolase
VAAAHVREPVYRFVRERRAQPIVHFRGPVELEWNRVDLEVPGLPDGLAGLRILHLTDLHFRPHWSRGYDRIIERVNADPPDLLVMTGDFVDQKHAQADPAIRFVRRFFEPMRAKLGAFAIFGNHDYRLLNRWGKHLAGKGVIADEPWARPKQVRRPIEEGGSQRLHMKADDHVVRTPLPPLIRGQRMFGMRMLENERVVVEHNGAAVELVGFRGTERPHFDMEFLAEVPAKQKDAVRIVLSHHPDNVRLLKRLRADVVLSGHTHGGQICLPGRRALITHDTLPKKCCAGVHRWEDSWLVISRGLGFSTIPMRVFCPPEILDVRLTRVAGK